MKTAKALAIILQIAVYVFMLLGHVPAAFQTAVLLALAVPIAIGTRTLYCGYIRKDKYLALKAHERKALERNISLLERSNQELAVLEEERERAIEQKIRTKVFGSKVLEQRIQKQYRGVPTCMTCRKTLEGSRLEGAIKRMSRTGRVRLNCSSCEYYHG